jgi:hypothetical protein
MLLVFFRTTGAGKWLRALGDPSHQASFFLKAMSSQYWLDACNVAIEWPNLEALTVAWGAVVVSFLNCVSVCRHPVHLAIILLPHYVAERRECRLRCNLRFDVVAMAAP